MEQLRSIRIKINYPPQITKIEFERIRKLIKTMLISNRIRRKKLNTYNNLILMISYSSENSINSLLFSVIIFKT